MMIGSHSIAHWCRVQERIALSSGEAELYAGVRGISEAIHIKELTQEMGLSGGFRIEHHVDAAACKGILLRRGAGQLNETKVLWILERITQYQIKVRKIPRELNPSDLLASPCDAKVLNGFLELMRARCD